MILKAVKDFLRTLHYNLFLDDNLIDYIVIETNCYRPSKDLNYKLTNIIKIQTFIEIILQMGYVVLPKLDSL